MRISESEPASCAMPAAPAVDAAPAPGILLTTALPSESTAWSTARRDVGQLLGQLGYATLPLPATWNPLEWLSLDRALNAMLPAGAHLLIEYPFEQRKRAFLLRLLCRRRGAKLYALIHDLDSLRSENSPVQREIAILKLFDGLISHTSAMTRWLRQQGCAGTIVEAPAPGTSPVCPRR
jgi:hypothetical protein